MNVTWQAQRLTGWKTSWHAAGFTIPPNYSAKQIYHAIKAPAWTWDFVSNDPYNYACINTDVPADSLAAFVNSQINPAFNWEDAEWLMKEWDGPAALKGVVRPDDAQRALKVIVFVLDLQVNSVIGKVICSPIDCIHLQYRRGFQQSGYPIMVPASLRPLRPLSMCCLPSAML